MLCPQCQSSNLWEIYEEPDSEEIFITVNIQCSNCSHVEVSYKVRIDVGVFL